MGSHNFGDITGRNKVEMEVDFSSPRKELVA
jgi:hypothetical protein